MYNQTHWQDHVVEHPLRREVVKNDDGTVDLKRAEGEVIQQGTPQSATNFNNAENGIQDAHVAKKIFLQYFLQFRRWTQAKIASFAAEFLNEITDVSLMNSSKYPFNDSEKTVSIKSPRKTTNYDVTWEIVSADGNVGDVHISDKQLNGFKIRYDGSAKNVKLKIRVKGGTLV